MSYTYEELKKKTVAELREIAKGIEHEAVKGYTQLNKEHLLDAICKALEIDKFVHHRAVVSDKSTIKRQIRELKKKREEALASHNHTELKSIRLQIRHLKKKLRKAAVKIL
jgi:DNA polymerase III alpha subunit (gram-positive type)